MWDFSRDYVNINGGDIYPIAEVLSSDAFLLYFLPDYNRASLPPRYQQGLVLQKPFRVQDLQKVLVDAFACH